MCQFPAAQGGVVVHGEDVPTGAGLVGAKIHRWFDRRSSVEDNAVEVRKTNGELSLKLDPIAEVALSSGWQQQRMQSFRHAEAALGRGFQELEHDPGIQQAHQALGRCADFRGQLIEALLAGATALEYPQLQQAEQYAAWQEPFCHRHQPHLFLHQFSVCFSHSSHTPNTTAQ